MSAQHTLISELEETIAHDSAQRRGEILLQVANLFVRGSTGFSDEEIELFDDVITRLATEIEVSVRALLAHCLAPLARAPINITKVLASDDDIRVAGPILIQSERLDQDTLLANARAKGQAHLLAISKRKSLSEAVTDLLVERGGREVVLSAIQNLGAKFSDTGFSLLVERCYGDDQLATCVGSRQDIPSDALHTLLAAASEVVRRKLIAEHPLFRRQIEYAVKMVTAEFRNGGIAPRATYAAAQALVQSLSESGQLTDAAICSLAEDRKVEEIIAAVAHIGEVPVEIVERAFLQDQSETIVVLAKAAGLSWSTAKALLSFRAEQRGLSSTQIERSMASFDRLNLTTAKQIVEFYKTRGASASHQEGTANQPTKRPLAAVH